MKLLNKYYLLFVFLLFTIDSIGQPDTLEKLSFVNFMQMVKHNHPVAKQADLLIASAEANSLIARGGFDPKLFYDFKNKFYDSKNYYELSNGGFNIPTWLGLDLKAGYEQNNGVFLNPENNMPSQGLFYSQISLPLAQGLVIDERRATLKQAKVFKELSMLDKIIAINELLYKAGKAYWDWELAYNNVEVYKNAVDIGLTRFEAVKKTSLLGDRPAIDTLESNIQLQDRVINLQQALLDYRTKSLTLSNFLWLNNDVPIELTDKTVPEKVLVYNAQDNAILQNIAMIDSLINVHPNLKTYYYKQKQLSIEKKLKLDKLKPIVNVNFNPLFKSENINLGYQNNYKWGVGVGFPLFLRKERGDLQLTKIKIKNIDFENLNKRNELLNKTKATINEYGNYQNQATIFGKNVINYEQLWLSEKRLFDSGESSLFMINSREMNYINAQIKMNELINKNKKAALDVEYSLGLLFVNY